jgi:hypothetical protein
MAFEQPMLIFDFKKSLEKFRGVVTATSGLVAVSGDFSGFA